MSYFAGLTPVTGSSEYAPASYTQSQDAAINTLSKHLFSVVTASIDFAQTGQNVLFTTASDRGRFFPTNVMVICELVSGSAISGPDINIGKTGPSYNDWVNATLTTPSYNSFASGQFEFPILASTTLSTSAAPSTNIYYKIDVASGTCDKRSIVLIGFYTGTNY